MNLSLVTSNLNIPGTKEAQTLIYYFFIVVFSQLYYLQSSNDIFAIDCFLVPPNGI